MAEACSRRRLPVYSSETFQVQRSARPPDRKSRLSPPAQYGEAVSSPSTSSAAAPEPSGRLELTWTNKALRLLSDEVGGYTWVHPPDFRVAEVRLLDEAATVGTSDREAPNLLMRGDALHALTGLLELPEYRRKYAGKVKLCYIDPPFNTGQAFSTYDDALEHSVWLTMMRDRLVQVKELLHPEGSVWVHLDDAEMAYCRVILDELFGRPNFVATVVWEKADSPRNSARQFSVDQDYILVYSRNPDWKPRRLPRTAESDAIYANPDDDPRGPWIAGDPFANKPYSKGEYKIEGPTGRSFEPPPGRYWRISEEKFWEFDADGRIWWGGAGDARPSIKRYLNEVADLVPRTLWRKEDVGSNRSSKNEMRRLFPGAPSFDTPKPEKLMSRVLQIATIPGDLVLDCFAGSGTTAAVAHKLGRRWITVERSPETTATYTLPRLTQVVEGNDPGGVTEDAGWTGGGGFTVLDVAPSMFEAAHGMVFLSDWATSGYLAQTTAAQLGYTFEPDGPFSGRKGRSRLAVVDGVVNETVVRMLVGALGEKEVLEVAATSVDDGAVALARELRRGSRVRKIPQAILRSYQRTSRLRDLLYSQKAGIPDEKPQPPGASLQAPAEASA
jgi:adenine-specific DNA-methyltransferase